MIEGKYSIELKTPMGIKNGLLSLKEKGAKLAARLFVLGEENELTTGKFAADSFVFSGSMKTAVGEILYNCSGHVKGDELVGTIETNKGNIPIKGRRVEG